MANLVWAGNLLPFWSTPSSDIFEDFWKWRLEESPEFSTFLGNHSNNHRLESYNLKSFKTRKAICEDFLRKCQNQQQTSLHLSHLVNYLQTYLDGFDHQGYLFPINYLEGLQFELQKVVHFMPFRKSQDFYNLLSRFRALPTQVQEIIEILKLGIRLNKTYHAMSMAGVADRLDFYLNTPAESLPFYAPFMKWPYSIKRKEMMELRTTAKELLTNTVLPAFKALHLFLTEHYMQATRPNISVSSLPNGEKFYAACFQFYIGLPLSPAEIHQMGIDEVKRVGSAMDQLLSSLGVSLTRREFAEKLKSDPQQLFNSKGDLLHAYITTVEEEIRPRLKLVFYESYLPANPLDIRLTPPSMEHEYLVYYLAGSKDRRGTFFVNAAELKYTFKYAIMCLCLHEAFPGHHMQLSFMENQKVPDFRRCVDDHHFSSCPSRFPLYTAYYEGWGLYSEYLGYEMGLYNDPYVNYGYLAKGVLRACLMVVDTGVHALGWSHEQAVNYLTENTAETQITIAAAIRRIVTWPGRATAFKFGELFIKSLRNLAQEDLGPKFCLEEFHRVILQNMGPLNSLETQVRNYIKSTL